MPPYQPQAIGRLRRGFERDAMRLPFPVAFAAGGGPDRAAAVTGVVAMFTLNLRPREVLARRGRGDEDGEDGGERG